MVGKSLNDRGTALIPAVHGQNKGTWDKCIAIFCALHGLTRSVMYFRCASAAKSETRERCVLKTKQRPPSSDSFTCASALLRKAGVKRDFDAYR